MKNLATIALFAILIVSCTQTRTPTAESSSTPVVSFLDKVLFQEIKSNQIKWQRFGISNYQITIEVIDLTTTSGTYVLDVKKGEITQVTVLYARWPESVASLSPKDYYELTIDGLFQQAYSCASDSPPYSCSFLFDTQYGYPILMNMGCDDYDICPSDNGRNITILDIKLPSE